MRAPGLQDVLVALLAAAALGWLVWRRLRARKGAMCEDCPGCAMASKGAPPAAGDRHLAAHDPSFVPLGEIKGVKR